MYLPVMRSALATAAHELRVATSFITRSRHQARKTLDSLKPQLALKYIAADDLEIVAELMLHLAIPLKLHRS